MTPEQALQLLSQVTAQVNAPREMHAQIIKALEVLKASCVAPKIS